jgi:hypothetical protein
LQYFGLSSITPKRKDAMRERIMNGWPFTAEEREQILDYCAEDVEMLQQLLLEMLPHIDLPLALHRGEFVGCLARSEHIGVPIDVEIFPQLADKKTWRELRDSMVPMVDVHGIYVCDKQGEWHWNNARFEELVTAEGINWPRTETSKLDLRRKTFESMAKAYPQIEPLRQLRYIRDKLRTIAACSRSIGIGLRIGCITHSTPARCARYLVGNAPLASRSSVNARYEIGPSRASAPTSFASPMSGALVTA